MDCYILLLFDGDDQVAAVRTIAAADARAAEKIASVTRLAHQDCAGYQLWRAGERIAQTYPAELLRPNRVMSQHAG
jgi:hypothetical protein